MTIMPDRKEGWGHLRAATVLAWVLLLHSSSANLLASAAATPSWSAQIRIGVQTSLSHQNGRQGFRALLAGAMPSTQLYKTHTTECGPDSLYEIEEWNAMFPQEGNVYKSVSDSARRSTTKNFSKNLFEQSTGFRQIVKLPAFLARTRPAEAAYRSYEEVDVAPCVSFYASNKGTVQQASFSTGLQSPKSRNEPNLHRRKERSTRSQASQSALSESASKGRPLVFWENMVCGAISRSIAQTIMHPANTMKTLLQQSNPPPLVSYLKPSAFPVLFRGAGANFLLSVPHGAVNFAILELVRNKLAIIVRAAGTTEAKLGPALDFMSSALATICTSVVSTPQMMITDNIMAGNYANLPQAVRGLAARGTGLSGFYANGWWPGLVGKIPSYALTWTFFQQLKLAQKRLSGREATNLENSIMGCLASGTTVCIMIPMDTIKTRLVTQARTAAAVPYKGIIDCAVRIAREEGAKSFYRGLPPRLVSVVPMIGIQFTVYEFMKRALQRRTLAEKEQPVQVKPVLATNMEKLGKGKQRKAADFDPYSSLEQLQESCMEVAASPEHPYPAPHFLRTREKMKAESKKVN